MAVESSSLANARQPVRYQIAACWGVLGVMVIVGYAIARLAAFVIAALAAGLDLVQWLVLAANVVFLSWTEGYRGFQLRFSPRVAARALYLSRHRTSGMTRLFAPLFCIGYFDAHRRTKIGAWVGTGGIVILILLVHQLEQPWRGIVDAGVVAGLTWGLISLIVMTIATFRGGEYLVSPRVPERYNGA